MFANYHNQAREGTWIDIPLYLLDIGALLVSIFYNCRTLALVSSLFTAYAGLRMVRLPKVSLPKWNISNPFRASPAQITNHYVITNNTYNIEHGHLAVLPATQPNNTIPPHATDPHSCSSTGNGDTQHPAPVKLTTTSLL